MSSECDNCKKLKAEIERLKAKIKARRTNSRSTSSGGSDGPETAFAKAQAKDHTLNTF